MQVINSAMLFPKTRAQEVEEETKVQALAQAFLQHPSLNSCPGKRMNKWTKV